MKRESGAVVVCDCGGERWALGDVLREDAVDAASYNNAPCGWKGAPIVRPREVCGGRDRHRRHDVEHHHLHVGREQSLTLIDASPFEKVLSDTRDSPASLKITKW